MPRTARASVGDVCYHVINRGNGRSCVFHKQADYAAFVELIGEACARRPMRVLAYALMPNHFHLVLFPNHDGDLSRWMQWLMTAHVRRHHRQYGTSGHVWQGRFKAFPIQRDEHLLTVMAYVERNPLRAGLVQRAEDWPWSSLRLWMSKSPPAFLNDGPVDRPRAWLREVNRTESDAQLAVLRRCVYRGAPFGTPSWTRRAAIRLGLESAIHPRGRPRKEQEK